MDIPILIYTEIVKEIKIFFTWNYEYLAIYPVDALENFPVNIIVNILKGLRLVILKEDHT